MRIQVVGGGPAGLYFALLAKRRDPARRITVWERNPRDATFGWGVVFSEQTLSYLEGPDAPTFAAIQERLVTWDNVDVVHRGEKVTIRGNRFAGIARIALLRILQARCEELGVELRFGVEVGEAAELGPADLLVGADGVRSGVRESLAAVCEPSLDLRPNRYAWYGTRRLFHGLTLTFRENRDGLFIAHSYKFSRELSTFIVECDEGTFARAGLGAASDEESRRYLEEVFSADLGGEPLLSNQSRWIQFATVRCRRWHDGAVVLLGDAAHTAHFSIGSGTKLALEDAIALDASLAGAAGGDLQSALAAYERSRRGRVEQLQGAAQASLEWFENAAADLHLDPLAFAYRVMTRSERVDLDSLRQRDPEFAARVEAAGIAAAP
jgi:2-polyprenyl-6-methoxyphenol hydroxylase-like FAD-dependent oxidoreductase